MWLKGNIHTHTNKSDGDSDPESVISWYQRNSYDFLVLTDHNHLTILNHKNPIQTAETPLMIPGEEVSVQINNGATAIHLGAIGITNLIEPIDAIEVVPTLQANIDTIRSTGGVVSINHPNYTWAFDDRQIIQLTGANLLEIFNGNNVVNNFGGGTHPSCEEIWDLVLSANKLIFGVAVDDSHHFKGDFQPGLANPGRGWVMVNAPALEKDLVINALESGNFYSSTGVTLDQLIMEPKSISFSIKQEWHMVYVTEFVIRGGQIISKQTGIDPSYSIQGNEGYVRAKVSSSDGSMAWTQPIFTS